MQLVSIDTPQITPAILRQVADIFETTGVGHHKAPILKETNSDDIATACAIWYDRVCINILENIFASLDQITIK